VVVADGDVQLAGDVGADPGDRDRPRIDPIDERADGLAQIGDLDGERAVPVCEAAQREPYGHRGLAALTTSASAQTR
jgi:hypothetical protein